MDVDQVRQLLTVEVKERSGAFLPARTLSDGTLRFLALSILAEDPEFNGVLCFEEPENGIHPARVSAMLDLLKELSVDPSEEVSESNSMRQIVVATHSPVLVSMEEPNDLIFADVVKVRGPNGMPATTIRCKCLRESWRFSEGEGNAIDRASIISYLELPPDRQISLNLKSARTEVLG
uniref:AAA family ATPase n=1 Tax=Xanthomonas axonopodis TaxID=53413 RepID=UPI001F14D262